MRRMIASGSGVISSQFSPASGGDRFIRYFLLGGRGARVAVRNQSLIKKRRFDRSNVLERLVLGRASRIYIGSTLDAYGRYAALKDGGGRRQLLPPPANPIVAGQTGPAGRREF